MGGPRSPRRPPMIRLRARSGWDYSVSITPRSRCGSMSRSPLRAREPGNGRRWRRCLPARPGGLRSNDPCLVFPDFPPPPHAGIVLVRLDPSSAFADVGEQGGEIFLHTVEPELV